MDIGFPTPELLSALRGYSGHLFVHETEFGVNEADPLCLHIPTAQLDVAKRILPLASDYKKIQDYTDEHFSDVKAYPAALSTACLQAMVPYCETINVIENDFKKTREIPLTLLLPILKFKDSLCLVRTMLESYENHSITFNQLLSKCFEHSQSPFSEVSKCFKSVLSCLLKTFWDDVWSWMVFGHLKSNSSGEFFITERNGQATLVVDNLPSFVSMRVGEKIFFTGHLVRYFTSCHVSHDIAQIFGNAIDEKFSNVLKISSVAFKIRPFNLLIESIRKEAAFFSWHHAMADEDLLRHFNSIRDIYFTRNENLSIFLVEHLRRKSLKNVPQEKKHHYLRMVIETILCKFYLNQDAIDEFVSKLEFSFQVTDKVLPQISVRMTFPPLTQRIFQPNVFVKYDKMLNFLLEVTLVKRELSESWKRSTSNKRINPPHWFTRHKLLVLFDYIYYYYKVNTIESSCENFVQHLEHCQDYEQMELKHKSFLVTLMRDSFLELEAVENLISQLMTFVHDHFGKDGNNNIVDNDIKNLERLFSDLYCLLSTLKSFKLSPSLSQLVFQLHGCLKNE